MKIMVVGTGYVGLTVGIGFAELGHEVVCYDKDTKKIKHLKEQMLPIYEENMELMLHKNEDALTFTDTLVPFLEQISVLFLAIGTPSRDSGEVDTTDLFQAISKIGAVLSHPVLIINKCTAPPGTVHKINETLNHILLSRGCDFKCDVVSNPEFLHEGRALHDFINPDRIIIGTDIDSEIPEINILYSAHIKKGVPVIYTDIRAAELLKYVNNAVAALKISFINEIANICEKKNIDVWELIQLLIYDKRVSPQYLSPGIGFGGSCLPKDIKALKWIAENANAPFLMTDKIIEVNKQQAEMAVSTIKTYIPQGQLTVLGTAFKAGTNDIRESPSINIIKMLASTGNYILHIYDPQALEHTREELHMYASSICCIDDIYEACSGSGAVVILTGWSQFGQMDLKRIKENMSNPLMLDFQNVIGKRKLEKNGFQYYVRGSLNKEALDD